MHLLLVDDDPMTLEFMKIFLEGAGHQVTACTSQSGALAAFSERRFDALVTDISIRDGSGTELGKRAKELGISRIIAVTGHSEDRLKATDQDLSSFSAYLTKPVDFDELTRLLTA